MDDLFNAKGQGFFRSFNHAPADTQSVAVNDVEHLPHVHATNGCGVESFIPIQSVGIPKSAALEGDSLGSDENGTGHRCVPITDL